jgi:hypothetical protein
MAAAAVAALPVAAHGSGGRVCSGVMYVQQANFGTAAPHQGWHAIEAYSCVLGCGQHVTSAQQVQEEMAAPLHGCWQF